MKIALGRLRRLIREEIDMGDTQFSQNRLDDVDKTEPDTQEEAELFQVLRRRLGGVQQVSPATAQTLIDLINSDKYGERGSGFFGGPVNKSSILYRGHAYSREWVKEHIDIHNVEDVTEASGYREVEGALLDEEGVYFFNKPYEFGLAEGEGYRGWTRDMGVAAQFASQYAYFPHQVGGGDREFAVILCMAPEDNDPDALLQFSRGIYKVRNFDSYSHEQEVLNLKPVRCRFAYIVRKGQIALPRSIK